MTLQEYLNSSRMTHDELAKQIPCARSYITLIAGGLKPSYKFACRLEDVTQGQVPKSTFFPEKTVVRG